MTVLEFFYACLIIDSRQRQFDKMLLQSYITDFFTFQSFIGCAVSLSSGQYIESRCPLKLLFLKITLF